MAIRQPSFILFDLGNVLAYISPEAFLQRLGLDTSANRQFYQPGVIEIVHRYESGHESTDEFLSHLDKLFNAPTGAHANRSNARAYSPDEFRQAMLAIIQTPVDGMLELVTRLSSTLPLGLLSNTNPLHYEWCMEHLPVMHRIPHHFLSYKLQSLKPEPLIFTRVVERLGVPPEEVFYIDDIPVNIAAGQKAGFHSHLFRGREELERELSAMNLWQLM